MTTPEQKRHRIARRVAREFRKGDIVNLGIGIPTLAAEYLPKGVEIQSENGVLCVGKAPARGKRDPDLINAGGGSITVLPGASYFDSLMAFAMIRSGAVDIAVLGALQVDELGNLASWMVPGGRTPGIGGSMDLVVGAKKIIVATEHTDKHGKPKIVRRCHYPLTAEKEVDLIVTELAVLQVTKEGLILREIARGLTVEDIRRVTEADFELPAKLAFF